jgi:acyl-CoA synthetase (AMP-forming)/AMP-acid ligase II
MNIADALSRWSDETPFRVAIVDQDRTIHYRLLDAAVWRAAAWLAGHGLRPGDRVGFSPAVNAGLWLVAAYALARIGAVFLLLDPLETPAVRAAIARRLRLAAVLGEGPAARLEGIPLLQPQPDWLEPGPAVAGPSLRAAGGDAPMMICLSSGTTAAPKAMFRTHSDHATISQAGRRRSGEGADDRFLAVTSFHFTFGLYHPMQTLDGGGTVRIARPPLPLAEFCELIDRENITRLALTPLHAREIMRQLPAAAPRFPGVRDLTLSTTVAPEALRREVRRRMTPNVVIAYGSNEAWYVTRADAAAQIRFPDTVGLPFEGVEVEIVDDRGQALPAGEVGLIRVRGSGFARGYIDDPEATAKAFRDGWYYPGDLGVLSPEGALFLKGRADDLINFDGVKIFPADIETALLQHEAVAEAAAFPVVFDGYRQVPAAAVILRASATADELVEFCQERLGPRAPRLVHVLDGFPRNAIGKVLKRELAKRFSRTPAAPDGGA